jgi:hypothetical protein
MVSQTTAPFGQRRTLLIEKFPITIFFGLEYGTLVVLPAIMHHTSPFTLIIAICAVGTATPFFIEALRCPLGPRTVRPIEVSPDSAILIILVGWIAAIVGSITGGIAYVNQTTSASPSHLAAAFTPLADWLIIGTALVMTQTARGLMSRKLTRLVILISFVLELALSLRAAILSSVITYVIVVTFLALVLGLIRWRWVVVALITVPVVLPTLYNFKTQERSNLSQTAETGQNADYGQRLRLDLELAQVADFPTIPAHNIDPPSLPTLLLFGLVPRMFDQSRGTLHTGENLSAALGGSPTSSDSMTSFGYAYVVDGWTGVLVYSGLAALVTGMVIRRRGPWGVALLALVVQNCLLIEQPYPDMLAGLLQGCVSWAAALAAVQFLEKKAPKHLSVRPPRALGARVSQAMECHRVESTAER